ncbi:MAG: hypothetical protein FD123_250 [Bacteroidetes bacterium]|nr:MAG: hypothetical protein FD123_250 [Bacteroidota bacterium]
MKTYTHKLLLMILSVIIFHPLASAQFRVKAPVIKSDRMLYCLNLTGTINYNGTEIDAAEIILYLGNKEISRQSYTPKEKFLFLLEQNNVYTLEVIRAGMITRYIRIDTSLPDDAVPTKSKELYYFDFELSMLKESQIVVNPYADLPIALIRYDKKRKAFDYNKDYTADIKKKIGQKN